MLERRGRVGCMFLFTLRACGGQHNGWCLLQDPILTLPLSFFLFLLSSSRTTEDEIKNIIETSGQSYKGSTIVNYDSRVVPD